MGLLLFSGRPIGLPLRATAETKLRPPRLFYTESPKGDFASHRREFIRGSLPSCPLFIED